MYISLQLRRRPKVTYFRIHFYTESLIKCFNLLPATCIILSPHVHTSFALYFPTVFIIIIFFKCQMEPGYHSQYS